MQETVCQVECFGKVRCVPGGARDWLGPALSCSAVGDQSVVRIEKTLVSPWRECAGHSEHLFRVATLDHAPSTLWRQSGAKRVDRKRRAPRARHERKRDVRSRENQLGCNRTESKCSATVGALGQATPLCPRLPRPPNDPTTTATTPARFSTFVPC
jgi:hypothetical protein